MKLNDFIGDIQIDSETYDVKINGKLIESNYVNSVPMAKNILCFKIIIVIIDISLTIRRFYDSCIWF